LLGHPDYRKNWELFSFSSNNVERERQTEKERDNPMGLLDLPIQNF